MVKSKEPSLLVSLIPVLVLMILLAFNIFKYEGVMWGDYSNHYILLLAGFVAFISGMINNIRIRKIWAEVKENLKSIIVPVGILLMVGALTGAWLISGIIPAMVYYGLSILSPEIFLPASVVISAVLSLATGSSWTTTATVGIALIGIGSTMGISTGMIAGAVISGAYFGDKLSPLSDTTNLAPAMAGTDLYTHIKYMTYTTVPSIVITLIVFAILSFSIDSKVNSDSGLITATIENVFNITPWLFVVPGVVVLLILLKIKPIYSLLSGVVLSCVFAIYFQPQVLSNISNNNFKSLSQALYTDTKVEFSNQEYLDKFTDSELNNLKELNYTQPIFAEDDLKVAFNSDSLKEKFKVLNIPVEKIDDLNDLITLKRLEKLMKSGGILGMLWTIFLIISAMIFGGIMDGVGALSKITEVLLKGAKSIFGLFTSTVLSCLGLNAIASDQYLAIVVPGRMYRKAFEDRGLAPENLSRTLEDSGTVTSVLIPWNTCGAYQSGVLGVSVEQYFFYAIFNWISPIVTLVFAYFMIKIRKIGG